VGQGVGSSFEDLVLHPIGTDDIPHTEDAQFLQDKPQVRNRCAIGFYGKTHFSPVFFLRFHAGRETARTGPDFYNGHIFLQSGVIDGNPDTSD
jgi:hypothetical protein